MSYQQPPQWNGQTQQPPQWQQPPAYYQQPPPGYQPPPMRPQPPPKKRLSRRTWIALGVGIVVLIAFNALFDANKHSDTPTAVATATPTTIFVNSQATDTPVPKPKVTQVISSAIVPTHGTPHLGGLISDFYGKYGTTMNGVQANGDGTSSVGWLIDPNNADGGYILATHFSGSTHVVSYITYNGPSTWSKSQYRDYLIAQFAPPGTVENTQANQFWASQGGDPYNPIAYTSTIGKFFLHISDGNGYMNTV